MLEPIPTVEKERLRQAGASVRELAARQLEIAAGRELTHRAVGIRTVLAVAVSRENGWCAYIGSVPGVDHVAEALGVSMYGGKMLEPVARAIFPNMEGEHCP